MEYYDLISRQAAIDAVAEGLKRTFIEYKDVAEKLLNEVPSAQPELDIGNDGTLYISVSKGQLDKIGRVLVEENEGIFCKQFY